MKIALVSTPRPRASFINRDLYGGMGIDDNFGTDAGVSFVAYLKAEGTVIPEITFPYLATLLGEEVVRFFDGARVADGPAAQSFRQRIIDFDPTWIVASTSYANLRNEVAFVDALGRDTHARTALFGSSADHYARDILEAYPIDFIVSGEAEGVLPRVFAGEHPRQVEGLWFHTLGGVVHTGRHLVSDLDALPVPDWDATPLDRYHYFPLLKRRPFATVLSSRGCTYGCDYCPYYVAQGGRFRARSARAVVDEIAVLCGAYGVRSVLFRDPSFGLDRERVIAICRGIEERELKLDWGCETRLDGLDDEVVDWLARAGCRSVEIGMDSLSPDAMKENHRKTMAPELIRERLSALKRRGIASAGLFIIGLPGDSEEAIRETIHFANHTALTYVNYEIPIPFPGTKLYDRALRAGWLEPVRFEDLTGRNPPLASNPELPIERLRALQNEGLRSFYVRPRRVVENILNGEALASARFLATASARFLRDRFIRRVI